MKKLIGSAFLVLASCASKEPVKVDPVMEPSKFDSKTVFLNKSIVITKPGVYDYKGVVHIWKGGGYCNLFGESYPAMVIKSGDVTVKNFGLKDGVGGVVVQDSMDGDKVREGVTLDNLDVRACYKAITLPERMKNVNIINSIFMVE